MGGVPSVGVFLSQLHKRIYLCFKQHNNYDYLYKLNYNINSVSIFRKNMPTENIIFEVFDEILQTNDKC